MATVPRARQTSPKIALSIKPAEEESPRLPTTTKDLARSGDVCTSPEARSIESPLPESPSVTTPTLTHQPTRTPKIRLADEAFDPACTNECLSSSTTQSKAFLHAPETPKTSAQENHSLLHLLDSKVTWSEGSDGTTSPYQEIEPDLRPTPIGLGGWFRGFGRWFGHSKQAGGVTPEVKIELDDMPLDEFPIIPHTSGKYKPPWLSLASNHPPGQSIVTTLDFSAFDCIVDELSTPALSNVSEEEDSN